MVVIRKRRGGFAGAGRRARSGFTLPEVLIVTSVLAVLLAAGAPHLGDFVRNQRVKTASFDLFSSLLLASTAGASRTPGPDASRRLRPPAASR
jgi:prepilin-type N-terminal cleavage/methylation domain-containing protein